MKQGKATVFELIKWLESDPHLDGQDIKGPLAIDNLLLALGLALRDGKIAAETEDNENETYANIDFGVPDLVHLEGISEKILNVNGSSHPPVMSEDESTPRYKLVMVPSLYLMSLTDIPARRS
jgi:hypothetical protein